MVFWYRAPKVLPQREKEREKNEKKQQSSVHVKREGERRKKRKSMIMEHNHDNRRGLGVLRPEKKGRRFHPTRTQSESST